MSGDEPRIGVFVCKCGLEIADTVDCAAVAKYATTLPGVVYVGDSLFSCSDDGQTALKQAINEHNLNRVIVAACSARIYEPIFRKCVEEAGLNRYLYDQVNLREHVSWCHTEEKDKATQKAKELVAMSVARVRRLEPLERPVVEVIPKVAVVGGGIAGISAALDLADAGLETYIIERRPTIGGQMALLDRVFQCMLTQCSVCTKQSVPICFLGQIMTSVNQHPRIRLLTYSELEEVDGHVGNFHLKVRKKSRYIDMKKCNSCGDCELVCPVSIPNEYEFSLVDRKAVYRPFPHAVPSKFTIDKRGYAACRRTCPAHVNVEGFVALLGDKRNDKALEVYRRSNPLPGVLGRVCHAPCEEQCERGNHDEPLAIRHLHRFLADEELKQDVEKVNPVEPDKETPIAIIGAGPAGIACAYDLVRMGYPVTIFEARNEAGGLLRWGIPEHRLPRDVLSGEILRVKNLGVKILKRKRVKSLEELTEQGFKAIFIGTGASKSKKLGVEGENTKGVLYALNFLDQVNRGKEVTIGNNVAVIGGVNAAVESARVALRLGAKKVLIVYRGSRVEMPAIGSEIEEAEREGVEFVFLAAPTKFVEKDGVLAGLTCFKMRLGSPDASGHRRPIPIPDSEFDIKVNNVIVAIGQCVESKGPIAELESTEFGNVSVNPITFETSLLGVFAGGDVVTGGGSVIEAVAAGKEAAVSIDRYLQGVDLAEGRPEILTLVPSVEVDEVRFRVTPRAVLPSLSANKRKGNFKEVELGLNTETALGEATRCLNCAVCCECDECVPACKLEAIDHSLQDEIVELDVGALIVATGFKSYHPLDTREFGYGTFTNVLTNAQVERLTNPAGPTQGVLERPSDGEFPKSVAFIQCVGSRDRRVGRDYCCYIGCAGSFKQAVQIKERNPFTEVAIYTMDVRTHGLGYDDLYLKAREMGVIVIKGRPSEVEEIPDTKSLKVLAEDLYTGERLETTYDMVVLASALLPHEDTNDLARKLKISTGEYGYLMEAHPKLRPVDAHQDGVFIAGACLGPMDIPKAVAYGKAAAAEAQALITPGQFQVEAIYAEIDTSLCNDCDLCNDLCPYIAITGEGDERKVMFEICQGCGTCAAACPQRAIDMRHYRLEQLMPQIAAAARIHGGMKK